MERREMVKGIARREERAWNVFLKEFGRMIYAVATRLDLDVAETEDHFQNTCLAILRGAPSLREPDHLSSWTYRLARRQGLDLIRRRRPALPIDENAADPPPSLRVEPCVLEDLERLEESARLLDALARLDGRCRDLLRALFLEDPPPSYEELGRQQGIPVGSIGPTRARCLEKLEKDLRKLSEPDPNASDGCEALDEVTRSDP